MSETRATKSLAETTDRPRPFPEIDRRECLCARAQPYACFTGISSLFFAGRSVLTLTWASIRRTMVANSSMSLSQPPSRGAYARIQELASGGMGSVELARALSGPYAGQFVAVKRLHPHLEREKQFADMFFDEAWITAGLRHPNVVQILDWGEDASGHYLAMEFVPGDSLHALLREAHKAGIKVPVDLAIFIAAKTAEGLHAAHELRNERGELRHLVHRDVSPSNVLLGLDGSVKLIDFGVAKARDRLAHTTTGAIKGKFGYMSPEQARGQPVDRRSDVFSLGIVLWEMLALRRLYRSESELEILRMIVEDPPLPIRQVRPEVPVSLENVLNAALAKRRDDRLGSCAEFADFLWDIYREQGFTANERDVAAFLRQVLPERCKAVEALLASALATPERQSTPLDSSGGVPQIASSLLEDPTTVSSPHSMVRPLGLSAPALTSAPPSGVAGTASPRRWRVLIGALIATSVLFIIAVGAAFTLHRSSPPASAAQTALPVAPIAPSPQPPPDPSPAPVAPNSSAPVTPPSTQSREGSRPRSRIGAHLAAPAPTRRNGPNGPVNGATASSNNNIPPSTGTQTTVNSAPATPSNSGNSTTSRSRRPSLSTTW